MEDLRKKINEIKEINEFKLEKNCIYRHFKGNFYYIVDIAKDCDKLYDVAIYRSIDNDENKKLWVRPVSEFFDIVSNRSDNLLKQKYRFEKIDLK